MSYPSKDLTILEWQLKYGKSDEEAAEVLEVAGNDAAAVPREVQFSAFNNAWREIQDKKIAPVPLHTEAELELIALEKAAFGKSASLGAQGRLVHHFQEQGLTPNAAGAKAAERAAAWGTKLGSLERGKNPHKKSEGADSGESNKSANGSDEQPEKKNVGDSKNPWKNSGPEAEAKRIDVIRRLGTSVAAGMAKAAGKTIGGQPLKRVG